MNYVTKLSILFLILVSSLFAQDATGITSAMKHEAQTQKRQIIALNIGFEDTTDAQKFWVIYDEYEAASAQLTDKSIDLIKEYAKNYVTMNGDEAVKLTNASMSNNDARAKLLKKTFKKIAKISKIEAARFIQIENRIGLMVRYQTALELPILMTEETMEAIQSQPVEAPAPAVEQPPIAPEVEATVAEDEATAEAKEVATEAAEVTPEPTKEAPASNE